jgi:hypothetical protein
MQSYLDDVNTPRANEDQEDFNPVRGSTMKDPRKKMMMKSMKTYPSNRS